MDTPRLDVAPCLDLNLRRLLVRRLKALANIVKPQQPSQFGRVAAASFDSNI
jgi:hypothetical protein